MIPLDWLSRSMVCGRTIVKTDEEGYSPLFSDNVSLAAFRRLRSFILHNSKNQMARMLRNAFVLQSDGSDRAAQILWAEWVQKLLSPV